MSNVFADFLLTSGLYDKQEVSQDNIDQLIELVDGKVKIDCYCKECQEKRIFNGVHINHFWVDDERDSLEGERLADGIKSFQSVYAMRNTPNPSTKTEVRDEWKWINWQIEEATRLMVFKFECSKDEAHRLDYVVLADQSSIMKIGQYPSVADMDFPELKKYQKILSKDDMKEIRRAIGLYAQGIGVGSYVYLRRIVERLIYKAQDKAIKDGAATQEEIENKRVVDRIKELKDYLPDVFVNNATIYGIISKGIHELSEEECLQYFPVLKECIFIILEKWEEERMKEEAGKRLTASISKITSNLK